MKPDKHLLAAVVTLIVAACLIVLTWVGTVEAVRAEQAATRSRVDANLANEALIFAEQINRQILGLDQTLRILVNAWQANPRGFDLEAWRAQASVLNGLSRDMVLTDETGVIRQSSVVEAINQNASGLDYFRALADPSDPGDRLYIGPATIDGIMRQWHMNLARTLHYPDGSFAGVIDADYRIASITDVFAQTNLGPNSFMAVAGLDDGKLRGAVSSSTIDPDASIGETPMFAAIQEADSGIWTGPSANDAVQRIHAFRRVPNRRLTVIVAMSEEEAMRPASIWRQEAEIFASCITALLGGLALILVQGGRLARRREAAMVEHRAILAASNAQFEVAQALAAAKAEQLEATLAGMTDGVSMVDAHLCLVEWNRLFPQIAGVPAEILRVGLPMEELLRAQIRTGQFGVVHDEETEVDRRMARLRTTRFGVAQRQRPDGHTIELRRNRLPDGGFVTLYSDITERKQTEEALREARAAAETANHEKSRFIAIVTHEIRTPLGALLAAIKNLADGVLAPAQQSLLAVARQSGEALFALIGDVLDISRMETGRISLEPGLFELRPLLDDCAAMVAAQAAERGLSVRVEVASAAPTTLLTDPKRLRQVQLQLLSHAVNGAAAGEILLTAEPGRNAREAIRLTVKDSGPVIAAEARERLFQPFSGLETPESDDVAATGLGLSICRHLVGLMGGQIGCETWQPEGHSGEPATGRQEGNAFWVSLPATALPYRPSPDTALPRPMRTLEPAIPLKELPRLPLPRTRILLAEDVVANQRVTAALLRCEGHHVAIAASGTAAVEAMKAAPYDLIFMDILMPGMSGQEATRAIRAMPEPASSTPIIALTASVDSNEEAAFMAAGMNGILRKPVSLSELLDALRIHVWEARSTGGSNAGRDDGVDPALPPILSVDRINELRTNLPAASFATLVEECLTDMDHRLPALRRALVAGAPGAVTAHAHALVGMAAGYGMAGLESRLRTIMNAARDGELPTLGPTIIQDLEQDFARAAKSLRDLLPAELV